MSYTKIIPDNRYRFTKYIRDTLTPPTSQLVIQDTSALLGFSVTKSGESNPNWRTQVRDGSQAGTAYSLTGTRALTLTPGNIVIRYSEVGSAPVNTYSDSAQGYHYSLPSTPVRYSVNQARANSAALETIYRKIDSSNTQWQGLSSVAEFTEVVKQFKRPFRSIVDLTTKHGRTIEAQVRNLRKLKDKPQKLLDLVSSTYLEWVFGVAPLIADAKVAAEALARFNYERDPDSHPPFRLKLVGRAREEFAKEPTIDTFDHYRMSGVSILRETSQYDVQYIVGMRARPAVDFQSVDRLLSLSGFQPYKFVPALHEVLPWSWLLDYFSNAGNVAASIGTSTAQVSWIVRTVKFTDEYNLGTSLDTKTTLNNLGILGFTPNQILGNGHFGLYRLQKTEMVRDLPSILGWPSLHFEMPTEHLGGKLSNLVAVLTQLRLGTQRAILQAGT